MARLELTSLAAVIVGPYALKASPLTITLRVSYRLDHIPSITVTEVLEDATHIYLHRALRIYSEADSK